MTHLARPVPDLIRDLTLWFHPEVPGRRPGRDARL